MFDSIFWFSTWISLLQSAASPNLLLKDVQPCASAQYCYVIDSKSKQYALLSSPQQWPIRRSGQFENKVPDDLVEKTEEFFALSLDSFLLASEASNGRRDFSLQVHGNYPQGGDEEMNVLFMGSLPAEQGRGRIEWNAIAPMVSAGGASSSTVIAESMKEFLNPGDETMPALFSAYMDSKSRFTTRMLRAKLEQVIFKDSDHALSAIFAIQQSVLKLSTERLYDEAAQRKILYLQTCLKRDLKYGLPCDKKLEDQLTLFRKISEAVVPHVIY